MRGTVRRGVTYGAVGALALAAWTPAALASPPDHAGPQEVLELDLVGDPVSLQCGERTLVFTGGTLVERVRVLSEEEGRGTRRPVGATLEDQFGAEYRLHGVATFAFVDGKGRFHLTGAVTGPARTDSVNSLFTYASDGSVEPSERGTCRVLVG